MKWHVFCVIEIYFEILKVHCLPTNNHKFFIIILYPFPSYQANLSSQKCSFSIQFIAPT